MMAKAKQNVYYGTGASTSENSIRMVVTNE